MLPPCGGSISTPNAVQIYEQNKSLLAILLLLELRH
jgi:hypothetical protein